MLRWRVPIKIWIGVCGGGPGHTLQRQCPLPACPLGAALFASIPARCQRVDRRVPSAELPREQSARRYPLCPLRLWILSVRADKWGLRPKFFKVSWSFPLLAFHQGRGIWRLLFLIPQLRRKLTWCILCTYVVLKPPYCFISVSVFSFLNPFSDLSHFVQILHFETPALENFIADILIYSNWKCYPNSCRILESPLFLYMWLD